MSWIESHQSLKDHPKLLKLVGLLRISRPAGIGHLHLLWWWALDYAPDGDLSRWDDRTIAGAALWTRDPEKFVQALSDAGWVDGDRNIHDWPDYAGRLIERRRADVQRKRDARARTSVGLPADGARTVPDLPTVPTRPTEPDLTVAPAARARDPLFDALLEACGMDQQDVIGAEAKKVGVCMAPLRKISTFTPEEILRRGSDLVWAQVMGEATKTPCAICTNWARLNGSVRASPGFGKSGTGLLVQADREREREEARRGAERGIGMLGLPGGGVPDEA